MAIAFCMNHSVAVGLMWLKMAKVSVSALVGGGEDRGFYEAKLTTARYFAERHLPDCGALRRKIEGGADSVMALPVEAFATAAGGLVDEVHPRALTNARVKGVGDSRFERAAAKLAGRGRVGK